MNEVWRLRRDRFRVRLDGGEVALAVDPVADGLMRLAMPSIISMRSLTTPVAWSWATAERHDIASITAQTKVLIIFIRSLFRLGQRAPDVSVSSGIFRRL